MPQGGMDLNAALAPGMAGGIDDQSILTAALNYWNNLVTGTDDPFDDTNVQKAAAIALLNAYQLHLNDPTNPAGYLPN